MTKEASVAISNQCSGMALGMRERIKEEHSTEMIIAMKAVVEAMEEAHRVWLALGELEQ